MAEVFITCPPLRLHDVKPVVCRKMEGVVEEGRVEGGRVEGGRVEGGRVEGGKAYGKWFNPEEAFFFDPVFCAMSLRGPSSLLSSPSSPRALSPTLLHNLHPPDLFPPSTQYDASCPKRQVFESAEKTLKQLLLESERIKQLVHEAEHKSKHVLTVSQHHNVCNGGKKEVEKEGEEEKEGEKEGKLVRSPSYVDLYDEELIESNNTCYMQ